ncbi:MAG: insulinase family protein [Acidobacteria bacterium]|jgi:zinc protease|nr:insulinase family protein [Acidobacteriota bacterium]
MSLRGWRALSMRLAVALLVAGAGASVVTHGAQGAQVRQWPTETPPRPFQAPRVNFPDYKLKTLPNGLQVLAVSQNEQPSVSFRLLIRAGAAQDAPAKPGVASFVAALLDQGTATRSAEVIANTIESAGGILAVGAANEVTFINGAIVKDKVELALDVASEVARRPAFAAAEIRRQMDQAIQGLQVSAEDPEYVANALIDRLVFGFHPYGRPGPNSVEQIQRITRDDLVAFHRSWFVPNNSLLAIVGDLTHEEAFAAAEKAFGSWAKADVPVMAFDEPPPPTRRLVVVDRPGAVQTEVRVGQIAVSRTHKEYVPIDMALRILGGEGANRLFGVLRSDRGLTYGASANFRAFKFGGSFIAETDTRSETTGEVLRLTVDEFFKLQKELVDPRELRGAQDYMSGNFPLAIETPSAIAMQVLNQLFFGLSLDELETYREQVTTVSVADIQRVAKQFLFPDRLSIVLVGDASTFVGQLKAMGFEQFERIPIAQLDLSAPNLRKAGGDRRD